MKRLERVPTPLHDDAYLAPYAAAIEARAARARALVDRLTQGRQSLADFASGHEYFGLHHRDGQWILREWAPNATGVTMIGDMTGWREVDAFRLTRLNERGVWELRLPESALPHATLYRLRVRWAGGEGDRMPAYVRRVVQDPKTLIFNAQVWAPETPYAWRHPFAGLDRAPLVYEAHVGMAQEQAGLGTYDEFRRLILPRIAAGGYTVVQLMAVMEHPYYGSFGYHVSSFFAASSRFGTPEDFKALVDEAHGLGIAVIIDLVHSHAVMNEVEGLSRFDGTRYQYFHDGCRGYHPAWDSRCFDYSKPEVLHFLLSNCRFWLDEYRVDGFRFDGVTSMLYMHHGLGDGFNSYDDYFNDTVDEDALAYLTLANRVIHAVKPGAITVAEDVSGMPGLGAPVDEGGIGFDYRLAMGVPDCWFKLAKDIPDEQWNIGWLWHELTNHRADERVIAYVESHDQALVGGKTMIFELIDAAMYYGMRADDHNLTVERGVALHKLARLATLGAAGHGYLNFIGNEFGHPEWVDFPREGNDWSYQYARRQWSLRDHPGLKYHYLADFDRAILELARATGFLERDQPRLVLVHESDKILVYGRAGLYFLFNFHPDRSQADYRIPVWAPAFEALLDSDEPRFGGQGRLAPAQRFVALKDDAGDHIKVYLPARCAMVLRADGA